MTLKPQKTLPPAIFEDRSRAVKLRAFSLYHNVAKADPGGGVRGVATTRS